ncbi:autotransporter secretion outer membrane protein TamA [Sphingomonas palmae]|uniref:Autotransporter secretion outer membrane protein TamA n=1 Tax=Sphingomonas palmae TaxID=1855283 RepID=A0A1H7HWX7_9SPHN|nr:BamA/TamA family outer membrane protein [Sphingomonas palmae]SEK54658.1 autotransporter secretion outer membrane protein TamA [Sphingomonas palmae]
MALLAASSAFALAAVPAAAQMNQPGSAPARGPDAPKSATQPPADPQGDAAIIPDAEFNSALPPLSNDINAPLEPMPLDTTPVTSSASKPAAKATPTVAPVAQSAAQTPIVPGALPAPAPIDPQLAQPIEPLSTFNTEPLQTVADVKGRDAPEVAYDTVVRGLDPLNLTDEFNSLSALKEGRGKAANATQVSARAREDEGLAVRLMKSLGYYDSTAVSTIEQPAAGSGDKLRAIVSATPGKIYTLGSIEVQAGPTVPPGLVRRELPLKVGDPVEAARIQGAEANVSLKPPQQGYPFVKVGQRDILLDDATWKGAYTLPVDTGPRSSFGVLRTEGDPVFSVDHLNVFPRFDQGQLYDIRLTDDLRQALVATGLFSNVSVEPVRTGQPGPDGTEQVDLLVRQTKGPFRSLSGSAGYGTGEGVKVEAAFTHRNLFPPEGALIVTGVGGTQQQGASVTFRRSNAGKRDRTVNLLGSVLRQDYDAFNAVTATISGRISYDSTPIWQKPLTYSYGFELVGTNEQSYDFDAGGRRRRNYGIVALPGQVLFDKSDSLLNPTKGYRLKLNFSPEGSVSDGVRPYARTMVEATGYYPVNGSLVIAGRARAGAIFGIDRDDLAPSRRYYGGGGGSVRGYGYQRLGPLDPEGNPVGGRSINEFAIEARYRFGDFGIVPFFDAGNAYEGTFPTAKNLRYGAGIGGRFYTNFGPMRVDVATPLNPREGDGKIALYISIGQAF